MKTHNIDAVQLTGAAFPVIALALLVWLQTTTGLIAFFGDAVVFTLYLILCVLCMVLGRASSSKSNTYTVLGGTLLMGAFLSAIVASAQVFELWEGASWINRMPQLRRPGGNMGQPNHLATLLVMGLASLLFLYESRKLGALASALLALTLLTGVAATESRTGVLSLALLTLWWFAKRKSLGLRLSPGVVAGAAVAFLALFWYWPSLLAGVMQSGGVDLRVNTSVGTRWLVWPQLIEAVLQRPWWGWGLGQVSTAHNAVVSAYPVSEPFTYAHNIVLDLAIGIGLPLTALIVLVTGVWLWRRLSAASQLAPWYCLALILPVAVHSMLEFPFAYAYFLVPVMFAVGALEGVVKAKPAFRLGVKPAAAMLLAATGLMAWSVVEYVAIEEDFRIVRFEALHIGTTPASYQRPHVILLTQLDALLHGGRIVPKPGMSADEVELARKVALRFPWPATQNRYAQSLALNGNPNEAIRQLRVMRALHGEKAYAQIKAGWAQLANEKYPQLQALRLP
ncbi:MAG: O-antigen ligase C-terminal domain-containing protein [Gammaproteobacteria bacterium]|uniref:PglL family O-oligosaccharyltransferase n=1 Tax=Rhodoferax sp. TaxID=50421 RepID=UPI001DA48FEF|nr:Wzy polymerase domain-containing protein [Rhodoferax sp.]MBU3899375.1 O-antigen ligase C-terminal domain-containing protein [Gammaproteobacteria bacterium]MBU3997593.1 O-antigen ligase C-terminal domain-containing protein [Gammaproteobacteria bacterium]MBU4080630.1 O-antigen ligase C-terminal domain-containing protein [Gammaproteobacteria bacterium]MBU4113589.1 O-antigen ligase C-terminal domain-containing protein [Gammaproteobacteria bacterium]MBU4170878.1 O-antigen ligase C-terminal domai